MNKDKKGLNVLIVLEVIALIVVLVVGLLTAGIHSISRFVAQRSEEKTIIAEDKNNIDMNAPDRVAEEKAEELAEAAEAESGDTANDNAISTDATTFSTDVQAKLDAMTTEEKVAQLFLVTVDAFTEIDKASIAGDGFTAAYNDYPVGGIVYETGNIVGQGQITDMVDSTIAIASERTDIPVYTAVFEQGGTGAAASPAGVFADGGTLRYPSSMANDGDYEATADWGASMASYLSGMGFNLNLGINADLSSTEHISDYTFGTDADMAGELVTAVVESFAASDVAISLRAFPGNHGMEIPDDELPVLDKNLDGLLVGEYMTFQDGIDAGAPMIQLADVYNETVAGDADTLCSVSSNTVSILRNDLAFDGIILSGDVNNSLVQDACDGNVAITALNAGVDMLYCTSDFRDTYQAVLDAVNAGDITEEMLNTAVGTILTQKME